MIFFIIVIIVCGLFVLNMLIGVILDEFSKAKVRWAGTPKRPLGRQLVSLLTAPLFNVMLNTISQQLLSCLRPAIGTKHVKMYVSAF